MEIMILVEYNWRCYTKEKRVDKIDKEILSWQTLDLFVL